MTERPNIVLIISQAAGRHLSCYGVDTVHTPTLERIASDGFRFTNTWAASAISSPAVAAMLSGLYPQANGGAPAFLNRRVCAPRYVNVSFGTGNDCLNRPLATVAGHAWSLIEP